MHELLGIILFVAYSEQASLTILIDAEAKRCLEVLNDPLFIEADIYWMFSRVMEMGIMELFNPVVNQRQSDNQKNKLFSWDAELEHNELVNQDKSSHDNTSWILKRCHMIHHRLLKSIDPELYNHLERQKIEPQMYLQRYLRCMLSREFTFADTLIIWDALFACIGPNVINKGEGITGKINLDRELILLDFICLAMIVFVRISLLQSDGTGILRRLLKFPPVEDIHVIIALGITYKDRIILGKPNVHPKPRSQVPSKFMAQSQFSDPLFKNYEAHEHPLIDNLQKPTDSSNNKSIPAKTSVETTTASDRVNSPKKSAKPRNPFALKVQTIIALLSEQLNE